MGELRFFDHLHQVKYRADDEEFEPAMLRIANALFPDDKKKSADFLGILLDRRFLPAGRIQAGAGTDKNVTLQNCYVSGTIRDTLIGPGSIMDRATEAAKTMKMGGGIGYDFSTLRPNGAPIETLNSISSGPVSFMEIYNAIGLTISSAGHRRGAQMGVMRVDHPDIVEFIQAKQNTNRLTGFNISVGITDEFMLCVKEKTSFPLKWGGLTTETVNAEWLWNLIMESTYDYAEPGVVFLDTMNRENNLYYCEKIATTNPCQEQPLPPHGACLLGSFNLTRYSSGNGFSFAQLENDIPLVVEAMDNVIEASAYPLEAQRKEALSKRRMGLGVTGTANAIEALGHSYGSQDFCEVLERILAVIRDGSYFASVENARVKGPFPKYECYNYLGSRFVQNLPPYIRRHIETHGIRNSHLTSIAPTGTISMCAGNVSSGIEPVFSYSMNRRINLPDGEQHVTLTDYGVREFGVRGKITAECTVEDHLNVLEACVPYVDSSVSKTVNVPSSMSFEDFKDVYRRAYEFGAKGVSTFRIGGKREALLESDDSASCKMDEATGKWVCS